MPLLMNSWAISGVASLVYLGLFLYTVNAKHTSIEEKYLLFGFCISGYPTTPNRLQGCHGDARNSHAGSFVLDSVMTGTVYYLYQRLQKQADGNLNPQITGHFAAMGAVILLHGLLHLVMSEVVNCYISPDVIPSWQTNIGYAVVGVFSFSLCLVILGLSFVTNGQGWTSVTIYSAALAGVILTLMMDAGLEWMLPSLFSVAHPLSCVAGLFSKSPLFTQTMGWTFLVATCMGILELTRCDSFYRDWGGHVVYDFWLHVTVLLCLPPFAPPVAPLAVDDDMIRAKLLTSVPN